MGKTIVIDPVTRISGFLEIKVEVEKDVIVNAATSGLLYRGFEKMLKGRAPLDAIYFTERICGICSTSHAMSSTLALEDALKISPGINDLYIRDIMHCFEFLHNHLRQFYYFTVPGFVKVTDVRPIFPQEYTDFRLPVHLSKKIGQDYTANIEYSRLAHEGLAVLGGKIPHTHGIFVGGVTVNIDSYKLARIKSIVDSIKRFINSFMMEDINIISEYYPDYFEKGISYPNFMSYGLFDKYEEPELTYVKPGVMVSGVKQPFEPEKISQNIRYAWYANEQPAGKPGAEDVDISKPGAYSFIKAPRYGGLPMEVGPLARQILSGEYTRGNSCMDRIIARVLEAGKIAGIMEKLIDRVEIKRNSQGVYEIPDSTFGAGLTDTIRGALGHWVQIENKLIKHYDIITPTMWNLSPRDDREIPGTGEKALIGSKINDIAQPVELGRITRSFDPCVSCATHLISKQNSSVEIKVLV